MRRRRDKAGLEASTRAHGAGDLQSSAKGTRNEKVPAGDPYAPLFTSVKRRGSTALLRSMAASTAGNARQKTSKHSHI